MKKIILTAALTAAFAVGASAKTADELRIYINPGHGSWTPDDRPATLVGHGAFSRTNTDTLSFFETNTNLNKGFAIMDRLISYGLKFDRTLNQTGEIWQIGAARDLSNNIVMSRVKNGPYNDDNGTAKQLTTDGKTVPENLYYYNRSLSEIAAEVEANNFDMFISIHSNAATEGTSTNFPLFLYRGYDTPAAADGLTLEIQQLSRSYSAKCWPYAYDNAHMNWSSYSATNMNIRGDINFYSNNTPTTVNGYYGYLGVLKHGTPGFLVEGYFHTYQPARHRTMNRDVARIEGTAYAHGIADIFGLTKEKTGVIYGIARDMDTKFSDAAYTPDAASDDRYLPLNGLNVTLKKGDAVVATYTTDNYYNGAFVFEVEPGTYTLEFEGDEYKDCEPVEVTVKAASVVYPSVKLRNVNYVPPTVVYENYPDPVTNPDIVAADSYTFETSYVDESVEALKDKVVRRVIARNGKLYILAEDKTDKQSATIVVYDAQNKTVLKQVSTEGTSGSVRAVGDIQLTADGVLVACNESLNHYNDSQVATGETRGEVILWRWANDANGLPDGKPVKWFTSKLSGNMYRANVGHSMAYSGTMEDGKIIMSAVNANTSLTSHSIYYNSYTIADGKNATSTYLNKSNNSLETLGGDFSYSVAPDDEDSFIISSAKVQPYKVSYANVQQVTSLSGVSSLDPATNPGFYRFAGNSFMASYSDGQIALTNLHEYSNAAAVTVDGTDLAAVDGVVTATVGEPEVDVDDAGTVTAAYMNLYAVRDGKISKFTTRKAAKPDRRVEYAYGLTSTLGTDNKYSLSFNLTGDVDDATVVITPQKSTTGSAIEVALGALEAGNHTVSVPRTDLANGATYTWAVRTVSPSITVSGEYSADPSGLTTVRGGVITITDPEYDSFGYTTVCHGGSNGIDVYDPAGVKVGTRLYKGHSTINAGSNISTPFRGHEREGKVLLATWGNAGEGIVAFDPYNTDVEPYSLFAGTKEDSGNHVYNGVSLGGGTSGICVVGKGDDSRIYSHSEDHATTVGPANSIVCYNIGSAWQITKAPVLVGDGFKSKLINGQGEMQAYGNGFFVSQNRYGGENLNSNSYPCFMYIDAATEKATFNSGVLNNAEAYGTALDGGNASLSITHDGKTLAVGHYDGKRIFIYDVTWNGTTPTLKFRYAIPGGSLWAHMRFDYAGNLHVFTREGQGYHTYVLAQENPTVTVPARSTMTLIGAKGTGVDDIAVDGEQEAPKEYYNLNGVRMADDAPLAPGIYIVRQGNKSHKVIVK